MHAFCHLFEQLDRTTGTAARVQLLSDHLASVDPADAAWALHCLLGKQRRRLITGRRLRQICLERLQLPEWLFEACYSQVGDSAETIALLLAGPMEGHSASEADQPAAAADPLHVWMEQRLPAAAALEGEAQAEAVLAIWRGLDSRQLLVVNKLLTGGFRVGVGPGLVIRALARGSGLEEAELAHRLMGGFEPSAAAFEALLAAGDAHGAAPSRPYPFFLASPLEPGGLAALAAEDPADWLLEWKWDGIRGQLIHRAGASFLWSRGEELIHEAFPDLIALADQLPDGTALDGEILVWPPGADRPAPFQQLQRRLGRKAPGRALLAECPAAFVAYDLLEREGHDSRPTPLGQRRAALEALHRQLLQATPTPVTGRLRLSERLRLAAWSELDGLRDQARAVGAEGLMLKAAASPYLAGRRRGHWWKHKLEPLRLDAVLLYAQAGSGRRANLFTDYTFGLWEHPPAGPLQPAPAGAPAGAEPAEPGPGPTESRPPASVEAEPTAAAAAAGFSAADARPAHPASAAEMPRLVTFAKAYSGLDDAEIAELDRWIRRHTTERFGPVRAVEPLLVFELAFEGIQPSGRHRSGLAVRFPRISRWRRDKPAHEADCLASALALLDTTRARGREEDAMARADSKGPAS